MSKYEVGEKVFYVGKLHSDFIGKLVTNRKVIPITHNAYHLQEFVGGVSEKLLIQPEVYNSPLYTELK